MSCDSDTLTMTGCRSCDTDVIVDAILMVARRASLAVLYFDDGAAARVGLTIR